VYAVFAKSPYGEARQQKPSILAPTDRTEDVLGLTRLPVQSNPMDSPKFPKSC
jgi:hypothetical protein